MRALLTATFLLAALLSITPLATAAPPTADPPDLLTPTGPPSPRPCQVRQIPCDITLPPLAPETTAPSEPSEPSRPATTTTATSAGRETPRTGSDTHTGTAAGPASSSTTANPATTPGGEWWLIAVPVLALLALAAAGAFLLIQRSERRRS